MASPDKDKLKPVFYCVVLQMKYPGQSLLNYVNIICEFVFDTLGRAACSSKVRMQLDGQNVSLKNAQGRHYYDELM